MKKNIKWQDEIVTKGYFHKELNKAITPLKKADANLREELHAVEFRLDNKMDRGFNHLEKLIMERTDSVMKLADLVIREHKNFEVESLSIKQNYHQLEGRVNKVEEGVFPK